MRVAHTPCFILHQRNYRETSKLLEVFSREYGRVTLVAKGIKRNKNNRSGLCQPNKNLSLSWSGKGEMFTLTGVEEAGESLSLEKGALMATFYLNELLMRLLHKHEPYQKLFDEYFKALTRLAHGENELIALRYFEKHLLDALGYGLVLDHEIENNESISSQINYHYVIDQGPYKTKPAGLSSIEINGQVLLSLAEERLNEDMLPDALKLLMRQT